MSYRPAEQGIEDPLRKIAKGIKEFRAAVYERQESNAWIDEHLEELAKLEAKLVKLQPKILKLADENW